MLSGRGFAVRTDAVSHSVPGSLGHGEFPPCPCSCGQCHEMLTPPFLCLSSLSLLQGQMKLFVLLTHPYTFCAFPPCHLPCLGRLTRSCHPAPKRLRQENHDFESSLGCVTAISKKKKGQSKFHLAKVIYFTVA